VIIHFVQDDLQNLFFNSLPGGVLLTLHRSSGWQPVPPIFKNFSKQKKVPQIATKPFHISDDVLYFVDLDKHSHNYSL
jgi:hypothetical protein